MKKKVILGQKFELSLYKITNFWDISGHQWTMPSDSFAKKSTEKISVVVSCC